jgi:hypothetical protein
MSSATNMSQMFFNNSNGGGGGSGGNYPVVRVRNTSAPAPVTAPAPARAPLLRMKSRSALMSLSNIMTKNTTPCRACGH